MAAEREVIIRWDGCAWLIKSEKSEMIGEGFETLSIVLKRVLLG
jgi:hypothetical protein